LPARYSLFATPYSLFATPMSWTTAAAVYFILWWVVLFAVLPWGVRSQEESGDVVPGSDPGAPAIPRLSAKLVWATLVSCAILVLGSLRYACGVVPVDDLGTLFGLLPGPRPAVAGCPRSIPGEALRGA